MPIHTIENQSVEISNGGTYSYTPVTGATWSENSIFFRFKGKRVLDHTTRYNTGSVAWHDPTLNDSGYSGSYVMMGAGEGSMFESDTDQTVGNSVFPATYANGFVAATMTYKVKNVTSPAGPYTFTLHIKKSDGTYLNTVTTGAIAYNGEAYAAANFTADVLTTQNKEFNAGCSGLYFTLYSQAWYNITYDTNYYDLTTNPSAECNDAAVYYTGALAEGVWSGWVAAPATFLKAGANTFTFSIEGSEVGYFEFYHIYTIPTPIDGWTAYGELADYRSYESHPNGYATTLMSGTWPTISGLNFGEGSIVLEFKDTLGCATPYTTWIVNEDLFRFDLDYDEDKLATVFQSKGSKVSGPMMYSILSDWATSLTLSASVDTFLLQSSATGIDYIYTLTEVPTADTDVYILSPNTSRKETVTVIDKTVDATGIKYTLDGNLTQAHYLLEEMVGSEDAKWYFEGTASDVTGWFDTMVAQYGAPDGGTKELDPVWPVKVGSEIVYMYSLPASTSTSLTLKGATAPYRGQYDVAYAHATGARAFCVPTVGTYPKSGSMYNEYGAAEVKVNPFGVVDTHTLDLYCWNGLQNSTTSATTARGVMPAFMLPATIQVGDWVNISYEE